MLYLPRVVIVLFTSIWIGNYAFSHSGGLDSNGCHGGSQPYHCHRAPSEMVGNRLRCELGSRSAECINRDSSQHQPTQPALDGDASSLGRLTYQFIADEAPSSMMVKKVQEKLKLKQLYSGEVNGMFDSKTALAIDIYKIKNNIESDAYFDKKTLHHLGLINEDN